MTVIIEEGLILDPPVDAEPLRHARILYRTIWRKSGATISASSETENFPATALLNELTYETWRPSAMPATWEVDAGESVTVDAVGIGSHNMASNGNTVAVEYFDGTWQEVESYTPTSDKPVLFLLQPRQDQRWRINISGGTAPNIGALFFGEAMQMERPIYGGHSPITLSRSTERQPNVSERGQWLGSSMVRSGVATDVSWSNLTAEWYRDTFDPFVEYATQGPATFFFAWRPIEYPHEVGYCWADQDDIQPNNTGTRDLMDVSMSVRGQVALDAEPPEMWA